jgi:hypothetical protein
LKYLYHDEAAFEFSTQADQLAIATLKIPALESSQAVYSEPVHADSEESGNARAYRG